MGDGETTSGEENIPEENHLLDSAYGPYDPRPGAYGDDDPGGGPYNPETGIRDWYATPEDKPMAPVGVESVTWVELLDNWAVIECDLHQLFGIDVESGILTRRTWRWLNTRIFDLINQPTRLRTALNLTSEQTAR